MIRLINQLKAQGSSLLDGRGLLLSLWQEIAQNFYVERADFTLQRTMGSDYASHLVSSYPLLMRRDLGNAVSAMLRSDNWFKVTSGRDKIDTESKQWLEWFTGLQRKAMYDRPALLQRATKEADNDFVTFGQAVLQSRYIRPKNGSTPHLHHKCWHLRDCAWMENEYGIIDAHYRRSHEEAVALWRAWGDKVHKDIQDAAEKKPTEKFELWHVVLPKALYDSLEGVERTWPQPFVSIYFDPKHEMVLEAVGSWVFEYTIPRFVTVSGSQYAHSPATIAALPDARLIQSVTRVLYEAGELAIWPTMIGKKEALRSDVDIRSGGFIAVDHEYDERLGEAIRPLERDIKNVGFGRDLIQDIRTQLKDALFLNKLDLPPTTESKEMTAFEVGQRVQEFVRNALPLFEPMEADYNGQLCEVDMQLILHNNPDIVRSIPRALRSFAPGEFIAGHEFRYTNPLRDAIDKQKIGQFQESLQIITQAMAIDKSAVFMLDGKTALRDVLEAAAPAKWLNTESAVDQMVSNQQAEEQQQKLLGMLGQAGGAAKDLAAAGSDSADTMRQIGPQ